jgi:hypothetical protein
MYYSYFVWALEPGIGAGNMFIEADGDVDGDGEVSMMQRSYVRSSAAYALIWEWPAVGADNTATF